MMLDPLGIGFRGLAADPQRDQEVTHDPVALAATLGKRPPGLGQENRPVGRAGHQPVARESLDGVVDRCRRDPEALRQIDRPCIPGRVLQIGDQFHVILGDLARMGVANPLEILRLVFDRPQPAARCRTFPCRGHPASSRIRFTHSFTI